MSVREGWGHYRDLKECQWKEEDQELKIKNFFFLELEQNYGMGYHTLSEIFQKSV